MIDGQIPWSDIERRYQDISQKLSAPALDMADRQRLQKEFSFLSQVLERYRQLEALSKSRSELLKQKSENTDVDFAALIEEELSEIEHQYASVSEAVETLLFPRDELDDRSVFLEIRAGTGGQEAALFAGDLVRMYLMYAQKKNWRVSVVSESPTDLGGYREVVLQIEGKGVYGHLKHESGVHRVQRVPATETAGRVHTSTVTVAVMPEAEDVEVSIAPQDVRIDLYRSSGAGGQHVNVTDSAVRLTHIPTGIVVACQDERSQHKNKAKAFKVLQARLLSAQREKNELERQRQRREQVGSGERSEKVRTYNYPQNRVTDHQVELTLKNLDMVMEGHLDPIIQALRERDVAERRKQQRTF